MAAELETVLFLRRRDQSYRQRGITGHRRADGIWTSVAATRNVEHRDLHVAVDVGGVNKDLQETHKSYIVCCAFGDTPHGIIVDGQRDDRSTGSNLTPRRQ